MTLVLVLVNIVFMVVIGVAVGARLTCVVARHARLVHFMLVVVLIASVAHHRSVGMFHVVRPRHVVGARF